VKAPDLGPVTEDKTTRPVVAYLGAFYDLADYEAIFNQAMLDHLSSKLPEGCSPRRAARVLRGMKTKEGHTAVLRAALAKLRQNAKPVPKDAPGVTIAVRFPALPG
jgi:hypothetical protein